MNSFFNRLKNSFKDGARRIQNAAKAAAGKIAASAREAGLRIKAAVAKMKRTAAAKARSLKDSFRRPAGTASSASGRQSEFAGRTEPAGGGTAATQAGRADFRRTDGIRRFRAGAGRFFVYTLDFLAGLAFLCAVVVALKPQLLGAAFGQDWTFLERKVVQYTERIGSSLIQMKVKITPQVPPETEVVRNFFVALFLALYIALKTAVALLARSRLQQKIVSVLMIALTVLACVLLSETVLIFAAICLIASFSFAFSCGFPARTIFRKLAVFIIVALCCYVEAHILTDCYGCTADLHEAARALARFGESMSGFFEKLRLF